MFVHLDISQTIFNVEGFWLEMIHFHVDTTALPYFVLCDDNSINFLPHFQSKPILRELNLIAISIRKYKNKERNSFLFVSIQLSLDNFTNSVYRHVDSDNSMEKLLDKQQISKVSGNGFPSCPFPSINVADCDISFGVGEYFQ